ncbi:MAG: methylenetetrahydrofolate--tRNA-(uracil(54)-C(5))-methyltransferase (FADH(2)-oxidizing) TrmFO [Desulfovibrio sp.]|uniref:methylenetetrahydrofolate--tRNA-(uracil(54)- C(5))-methyltransferase (FADH(2)-oxidizing) TrmFO n=1 Tax=Desulfovibrio sp. 7SRBS1 TaxID=3378064 RepID=UPI003B3ED873
MQHIAVIGGGLAGCECAWQLARHNTRVTLFEMRPERTTPAHETDLLAELVCSNSFRSSEELTAIGLLKEEMASLDSLIMQAARATAIPAGKALAVDRTEFARFVTNVLEEHENITLIREEITSLEDPRLMDVDKIVLAAGPLASEALSDDLKKRIGDGKNGAGLYFYDAIAPIVDAASVDMDKAFWGSRYLPEDTDYLNCPLTEQEYKTFVQALVDGEKVIPREFEKEIHFEGCMPVEVMAERGEMTLAFGPLKPVGLVDPKTGEQPYAVLQLRAENKDKTAFNMVGFQTKLTYPEQKRIFRMIPGLEGAEFLRLGSIHRNTYVNAPEVLNPDLSLKSVPKVHLAGQITGVEGYLESAACGMWLGLHLGAGVGHAPETTALGALMAHLRRPVKKFQPSNANFGLMPALNRRAPKKMRKELYAARTREDWAAWRGDQNL